MRGIKLHWLIIVFMAGALSSYSNMAGQCMMVELPLGERFRQSELVAEGSIVGTSVFRNKVNAMIYTAYRVSVQTLYKTSAKTPRLLDIIVEGGMMGNEAVTVTYAPTLTNGMKAIFFLTDQPDSTPFDGELHERYGLYGAAQGVIALIGNEAQGVFNYYSSAELRTTLVKLAGKQPIEFEGIHSVLHTKSIVNKSEKTLAAVVNSISPSIITGGTFSTLTINGSGFGNSYSGNARVAFMNANDGGSTTINAPTNHIVSWSDTKIEVLVPAGAGTGTVRVTGVDGTQAVSSQTLTIYYSLIDAVTGGTYSPSYLAAAGGGYTIQFSSSVFNNKPAANAFRRALTSWRCATFVNFSTAYSPTSITCYNGTDGVCVVAFANSGCNTPAGILAATYNFWSTCNGTNWHIREFDIMIANPAPLGGWNFGPGATAGGKFDFESVILHELGHAEQLGHIINASKVMHWSIGQNVDRRSLGQEDIDGGSDVVARAAATRPCAPQSMSPLTPENCQLPITPETAFSASPIAGCAPLTVQFTDQSFNSPASWQWDINNDGTDDYFTKNPTHTYSLPGTYSVKLKTSNVAGDSTLVKTNYITVYQNPKANAGQNVSACYGSVIQIGGSPSASNGTPNYTYSWAGTGAAFLNSTAIPNPIITLNFAGNVQCILTVNDANSCKVRDTVVVSAYPQISVNAGNDRQLCAGSSTMLGATPTASGGRTPFIYSWSPGATLNDSAASRPIATPKQTTDYILTVRDGNNCIVRDTVRISVLPAPTLDAGRDTTVCVGTSRLLGGSPTVLGGSPPFIYFWQPSAGLSSAVIPNPLATPNSTLRYILTVTDANNCQWYDTVTLTALPSPPPVVIRTSKSPSMCAGDTVTLDAGSGYSFYRWSTGASSQLIKVWEAGTYSVEAGNANGCSTVAVNPINVTLNPRPYANIIGPNSVCSGAVSTYLTTVETGAVYEWSVSGGTVQNGQGQSQISVKWTGTNGSLRLRKTFATTGCVANNSISVAISSTLKPVLSAKKTAACEGDSLLIEVPAGYASYKWSNGAAERFVIVRSSGNYSVTVTDNSGCSGTSEPMAVTFYPSPARPLINRRGDTLFSTAAARYQWKYKGAILSGETRQFLPLRQIGDYSVAIWDGNGCTSESSEYTVGSVSGVGEVLRQEFRVFPNPSDGDEFTIDWGNAPAAFEAYSVAGIQVANGILNGVPKIVSLSGLADGTFLIIARRGTEVRYTTLIKIH